MTPARRELALAAASGLALGAAFLPVPLGPLAWVAFVPLLVALERRVASRAPGRALFAIGYAGGAAFFLFGTHWIALLSDVAITVKWLKYLGWLLAGLYLALAWGLAAWLAGWLARRSGVAARWTFVPALLVVEELRGSGELGFPWFQPGYTQHAVLPVLRLAAWGGVTLVTTWVLAVNASLLHAARRRTAAACAPLALLAALPLTRLHPEPRPDAGRPIVALVQGDIPGEIKWSGHHESEILGTFLALSDSALRHVAGRPAMIVWPETATGSYLRKTLDQSLAVAAFAASRRVPVFTGYADYTYDAAGHVQPWNAAGTWETNGGLSASYAKRHLVPFGERMPFEWLMPALARVDLGQAEWRPGTHPVLFASAGGPFSCLICFESIFPDLAREDVRAGARWIVNITNDEWFGNSAALYQHADMAPFRAVENGVPLARCANTGVTEVIAPDGRIVARAPVFRPATVVARLPAPLATTPWTRFGDWPGVLAALVCAALAFAPRRAPAAR